MESIRTDANILSKNWTTFPWELYFSVPYVKEPIVIKEFHKKLSYSDEYHDKTHASEYEPTDLGPQYICWGIFTYTAL